VRIGIIGGIERQEHLFHRVANHQGHDLAFHSGHLAGRGSATLTQLVSSVALLLIVTDVNSHGAVSLARRLAREAGVPVELHRRLSASRFARMLPGLTTAPSATTRSA
jgi:hypothetical protein